MKKRLCYCACLALCLTACGQKGPLIRPIEETNAETTPVAVSPASPVTTDEIKSTVTTEATELPEETEEQ